MSCDTQADNSASRPRLHLRKLRKKWLLVLLPLLLLAAALADFYVLGLARRTFVFYAITDGHAVVEERMLGVSGRNPRRPPSRELDITRYVEEALLGPVSPDSLPLFPQGTRLLSLLYRNGVVYADLSEDAALPPVEGIPAGAGGVFINFQTLEAGIKRNFSFVRETRFFIAGKAVYADQFR